MDEIQVTKKSWQSKTLWLAAVNAVVAFVPPVQRLIVEHPETYALVLSGVFAVLRWITKGRVEIA